MKNNDAYVLNDESFNFLKDRYSLYFCRIPEAWAPQRAGLLPITLGFDWQDGTRW